MSWWKIKFCETSGRIRRPAPIEASGEVQEEINAWKDDVVLGSKELYGGQSKWRALLSQTEEILLSTEVRWVSEGVTKKPNIWGHMALLSVRREINITTKANTTRHLHMLAPSHLSTTGVRVKLYLHEHQQILQVFMFQRYKLMKLAPPQQKKTPIRVSRNQ